MIEIDDTGTGAVEVWMETTAGRWLLLARAESRLVALIEAERLIRDDLMELQEHVHEARQAERAR